MKHVAQKGIGQIIFKKNDLDMFSVLNVYCYLHMHHLINEYEKNRGFPKLKMLESELLIELIIQ